jgi:hypothetical protein
VEREKIKAHFSLEINPEYPSNYINAILENMDKYKYLPHIPDTTTELEQLNSIRFGEKRIYIKTIGKGRITSVINK